MKAKTYKLSSESVSRLLKKLQTCSYGEDCVVAYKGHVPFLSFVIVKGEAYIENRKKLSKLDEGHLVAFDEFCQNLPLKYSIVISKGAVILAIDKTSLGDVLEIEDLVSTR